MPKVKTAVVGVGALGRHHLKWLAQLPASELVGVYDIDKDKADKYALEYNVKSFTTLEKLAEKAEAVSIVTPTQTHFEIASFLIEQGLHCLIEKPVTVTGEQSEKLKQLERKKKVKVTVGHIERFNPAVTALENYKIKPTFIEAHRLAAFDLRGTDVAVVLDLMIHDIDLVLMLVQSKVVDIQASAVTVISEQVDIANARLTFENGAVANLTASRISLKPMRKLRIFQQSSYFSLDLAEKQADIYRLAEPDEKTDGLRIPLGKSGRELIYLKKEKSGYDMLKAELDAFLQAIIENKPVAVSVEQADQALQIALKIEQIGLKSLDRMLGTESTSDE